MNLRQQEQKLKSESEKQRINYMLRTLPETYSYIGDLVHVLKEEDPTVDYVKNKMKMFELKGKGDDELSLKSNALSVVSKLNRDGKTQAYQICGKIGHFKRVCFQSGTGGRGSWKHSRYQGGARGGSRQREGSQGRGYSQTGHWTIGQDQQWSGHETFSVTVETHIANSEVKSNRKIHRSLDTGSS
ncbi:hypothetical protein KM043_017595 [Ampulex compressa]|nr:hypothetical protein KM043_017595 [Ampulex compressa]